MIYPMICIKETFPDAGSVAIQGEGVLDSESIITLKNVQEHYLRERKSILLHLDELLHITREGKDFLNEIQEKVLILENPYFKQFKNKHPKKRGNDAL